MIKLIYNEMLKLVRKKRILVIILIVAALIPLFTYAQYKVAQTVEEKLGTTDWRATLQQQIIDTQNRLSSSRISDEWRKQIEIRLAQQQYYLDHDINPAVPGAPSFTRSFLDQAITLFLPLMVMVIAADLVSSEFSGGTIKLLLTRPINRWKILLSKYITMIFAVSFMLLVVSVLSSVISGLVFGYGGWTMPVITGFTVEGGELVTSQVSLLPQWEYLLMELGLVWFVCLVIGTLSFMLSILLRSTAAGMGVMLATLIAGAILTNMASSWESAKYLFMLNLQLTDYLAGMAPPVEGMTLGFSLSVLSVWGLAGLLTSFLVFTKRDVY
ncbi:ABC transporter permease [Ammoniphilus resinae]|uniref:ABC-2 type transport system permease protein n=1 Tax=Ammoniphilus resinae TaxID=861532 RepID=A0ABS4GKF6_9BACL|nr:ABC transporter permease [Ammoniphilus resinae]MBP1930709.1 ABC-2 type transport system permease protein [Ammoniphilus resinae]